MKNADSLDATKLNSSYGPSAVSLHCMTEHDGEFDLSVGTVKRGKNCAHRKVLEAVYCSLNDCNLNRRDEGVNAVLR